MDALLQQHTPASASLRSLWLGLAMTGSVAPYFFSESDQLRGLAVAGVSLSCLFAALISDSGSLYFFTRPTAIGFSLVLLMFLAIGYGTMRSLYLHNDTYYLAADLYHWCVELFAMALLSRLAFQGTPATSATVAILACLIVTLATVALVAGCYLRFVPFGGYFQGSSLFWHLKAGVNFPQIPLLICGFAVLYCREAGTTIRRTGWWVVVLSALLLIMTLKRTMWISTLGMACCVTFPHRALRGLAVGFAVLGIALAATLTIRGSDLFSNLDFMSYNENYRVTDTMEDRANQLSDAIDLFSIAGHGFGAEVHIYNVGVNRFERIHYIHSMYVYQILQLGVPMAALCFLSLLVLLFQVQNLPVDDLRTDWRVPAALACLIGVSLNGVTLVSTHSAFFGVAIGLAVAAVSDFCGETRFCMVDLGDDSEYQVA